MNKKSLAAGMVAGAAAYAGIGMLAFYEVTGRNAGIMKKIQKAYDKAHVRTSPERKDIDECVEWFRTNDREEFVRTNSRKQELHAFYMPADEPSDKFVICSHGYRSRGQGEFRFVGKFLHDEGYNVFCVDHQAAGDSDGKYISFGKYESEDLLDWVYFLIERFGTDIQIILYGISMGSASVMLLSNNENLPKNVKFILADCGYTSVEDEFAFNLESMGLPAKPVINAANIFNKLIGKWDFYEVNPIDSVKEARVPMLFVHGEDDDFVPTYMGCKLYNACPTEKDYLSVPEAGHSESYQKGKELYEAKFREFAARFIEETPQTK